MNSGKLNVSGQKKELVISVWIVKRGRDESLSFFLQQQNFSSFIFQQRKNSKTFLVLFVLLVSREFYKKIFLKKK